MAENTQNVIEWEDMIGPDGERYRVLVEKEWLPGFNMWSKIVRGLKKACP